MSSFLAWKHCWLFNFCLNGTDVDSIPKTCACSNFNDSHTHPAVANDSFYLKVTHWSEIWLEVWLLCLGVNDLFVDWTISVLNHFRLMWEFHCPAFPLTVDCFERIWLNIWFKPWGRGGGLSLHDDNALFLFYLLYRLLIFFLLFQVNTWAWVKMIKLWMLSV